MTVITNAYTKSDISAARQAFATPDVNELLRQLGFTVSAMHADMPMYYVVDYTAHKYLYIDPHYEKTFGVSRQLLSDSGLAYITHLLHRDDLKILNEKVFPATLQFLRLQAGGHFADYSFSFNYRVQKSNGSYITLLQRAAYHTIATDGSPVIEVGFVVDITAYKDDARIIHTIQRIYNDDCTLPGVQQYKNIYYPGKCGGILSKRELEILADVCNGLTSQTIAYKHFISLNTVNNHRKNMLQKTSCTNAGELIKYARNNGLVH